MTSVALDSFKRSYIVGGSIWKYHMRKSQLCQFCDSKAMCVLNVSTDAVYIHLNEQVDGKTLLGTYVCTEVPGDFRWQPGAVTQVAVGFVTSTMALCSVDTPFLEVDFLHLPVENFVGCAERPVVGI